MSNIFTQEPTQTPAPTQGDDVLATKLSTIVNEKGEPKYANVETALDALKASQEFIPSLKSQVTEQEAEIARLREQVAKQTGVQEALERFAQPTQAQPETPVETPSDQLGKQDVESLVQNIFNQHLQQTEAVKNFESVQSALVAAHGDQAANHIAKKAKELNTTAEYLEGLSRTNPTLALALLGTPEKPAKPVSGGTNSTGFSQPKQEGLEKPTKSLMLGADSADVKDYMRKIREEVYKNHGISQ